MQCPSCQFENPDGMKFCGQCGSQLAPVCPGCGFTNPPGFKFCGECGHVLSESPAPPPPRSGPKPQPETRPESPAAAPGERKFVTVLFSDMSGYTAMSERLDPEEVKEITSRIFAGISQIVAKYDGFVEKFVGDAVMAIFGVPKAHEDDPVRAIMAAREIHHLVDELSPRWEDKIGRRLAMHSGVNTGLVVTGEVDLAQGTHGVAGDTVNLAARLSGLAREGEIVVGPETFVHTEAHFDFKALEPAVVKGKAEPIEVYRLKGQRGQRTAFRRSHGLRAQLVGREAELARLNEAGEDLLSGRGSVFAIVGDAGTGKTRLIEEFKASLDPEKVQWLEGQAYAFSQSTPYSPMIDLLARVFDLEERDSPPAIKDKIESRVNSLVPEAGEVIPHVGSLFSLSYPEAEEGSPEHWRNKLQRALLALFEGLARKGPTVFCLEDLHWSDPSTVDCLGYLLTEFKAPAVLILAHRPRFSLLSGHQAAGIGDRLNEITLQDLSPSETELMLRSLLNSREVPKAIKRFVLDKVGGNPFYIEEIVNTLVESETLQPEGDTWKLTRRLDKAALPTSVQGLVAARLDRLEDDSKRILQEAAVIGRAFLYDILSRISDLTDRIDRCLGGLERMDLIRTRAVQPALEFMFRQAIIQEVVYNSLLIKERQALHERVAREMETLYQDRLGEYCETLAYHFQRSQSQREAVDYLVRAGEKSLKRYAVEESHAYFTESYAILADKEDRSPGEDVQLVALIVKWALVFYYRGDFKGLIELLERHQDLAESLDDNYLRGMFLAWMGFALWNRQRGPEARRLLQQALALGQEAGEQRVVGYACAWLAWNCSDLGSFDEAVAYGERAQEISRQYPEDQYLFFKSLGGIAFACVYRGDGARAAKEGAAILEYGQRHSNIRSIALGYWTLAMNLFFGDELSEAYVYFQKAVDTAQDPYYLAFCRMTLGMCLALQGEHDRAAPLLQEVIAFGERFGCEMFALVAQGAIGLNLMALGQMNRGLETARQAVSTCRSAGRKWMEANLELSLAGVYLQIVDKTAPVSLGLLAKNIGFVLKNVPTAAAKAAEGFERAAALAEDIGARSLLGQAYLAWGHLHQARGNQDEARRCFTKSLAALEGCHYENLVVRAREALAPGE